MENISFPRQSFRWKKDHLSLQNNVKSILNISKEEKVDHEQPDFLESFTRIEEGERKIDEVKPPEWMNTEIKTKEFNISRYYRPKMVRVGDYRSEKQTVDIVDLLKEYQDVFSRDYKYLKGLVAEMGEMKIELISGEKPIKKHPYNPIVQKKLKER